MLEARLARVVEPGQHQPRTRSPGYVDEHDDAVPLVTEIHRDRQYKGRRLFDTPLWGTKEMSEPPLPRGRGRPEFEQTEVQRAVVAALSAHGIPLRTIARRRGCAVGTLRRAFSEELRDAHLQIEASMGWRSSPRLGGRSGAPPGIG
jgi:lambda repressor-like predicted transcriptional regulator